MTPAHVHHAFADDVLGDLDAVGLAELVRRRDLNAREVVDAAIARAERVSERLNPIAAQGFEEARRRADDPTDGAFAGVPTFVKDNTPLAGFPTDHGSAAVRSRPASRSGPYAEQYMSLGFVCLGKSAMPEFGLNASTESAHAPPTRNPWHTEFSCGASSGGAAALVAAGVVPIAHANDGGGSIRIPAACCGLVGLKPTRGRHVRSESSRAMPVDLISEGVVTRTVRDTAAFHAAAERYYRNPKLPPIGRVEGPAAQRRRIGVLVDSITGWPTDRDTRAAVEATARTLADLGHHVESAALPTTTRFAEDFLLYWSLLAFGLHVRGRRIVDPSFDPARIDGLTRGLSRHCVRRIHRLPGALLRLRRSYGDYARRFASWDALLTPVVAHTTPRLGYLSPTVDFDELIGRLTRYAAFTPLANAAGAPAISLPAGRTDEGLPVGIQLLGPHGGERTLLELGFEIEGARPWSRIQDSWSPAPS